MIKAFVADAELTGLAAELEQELQPLMEQAVEAGAKVLLGEVRYQLSRIKGRRGPSAIVDEASVELARAGYRTVGIRGKKKGKELARRRNLSVFRIGTLRTRPPAYQTGELYNAMEALPARKSGRSITAAVGVKRDLPNVAIKAAALEYGGIDRKGRVHAPYPFMRVAEENARADVDAEIMRVLHEGLIE